MQTNSRTVRSATFAAIFGLTLATGAVGIPAALEVAPSAAAQTASNIDATRTGSITIHKRAGTPGATHDSGNEIMGAAPGDGLNGATFKIERLNFDLGKNDEFAKARALTPATALENLDPNFTAQTAVTAGDGDATGIASFENLTVGAYLVTETVTPAGHLGSAPFIVFVPMTNPDNRTEWNYNPHVYPKNTPVGKTVKTVKDANQNVGGTIQFDITSPVPGGELTKFNVRDDLDETRVTTATENVTTATENVAVTLENGDALEPGDYTVTVNEASQEVLVVFNQTGLNKLKAAKAAETAGAPVSVKTTITANVLAIGDLDAAAAVDGGDKLVNTAQTITNNGSSETDTTSTSDEVVSYLGKLKIAKTGDTDQALPGAVFDLYRCSADGALNGDKLTVNGENSWTTLADGTVTIDGLRVTDFENNAEADTVDKKYCLVETTAPDGYELLPDPVQVDFKRSDLANVAEGDDAITQVANIKNVKETVPNLPLTGGAGIGLIAALGALLVGAGAWWAKRNSSKA